MTLILFSNFACKQLQLFRIVFEVNVVVYYEILWFYTNCVGAGTTARGHFLLYQTDNGDFLW